MIATLCYCTAADGPHVHLPPSAPSSRAPEDADEGEDEHLRVPCERGCGRMTTIRVALCTECLAGRAPEDEGARARVEARTDEDLAAVERELAEAVRVRSDDTQEYYAACCVDRALGYVRALAAARGRERTPDAATAPEPIRWLGDATQDRDTWEIAQRRGGRLVALGGPTTLYFTDDEGKRIIVPHGWWVCGSPDAPFVASAPIRNCHPSTARERTEGEATAGEPFVDYAAVCCTKCGGAGVLPAKPPAPLPKCDRCGGSGEEPARDDGATKGDDR